MNSKWPNFFIIGVKKGGTTSLYNYLKTIPSVYMSPEKTPGHFWSEKDRKISTKNYLDLFKNVKNEKIIGEATLYYARPESAQGVTNTHEIVLSSKRISALIFGVFDLLNDLGIEYTKQSEGAKYARTKIPLVARSAGVYALDAIWQDLNDEKGLIEDCNIGKSLGYVGKTIIHPDQISITHKAFHPNNIEIEWAKKVCETYEKSINKGKGATTVDGKMVDEVHYKQAKALLKLIKK